MALEEVRRREYQSHVVEGGKYACYTVLLMACAGHRSVHRLSGGAGNVVFEVGTNIALK